MTEEVLSTTGLSRNFGRLKAVDQLSFTVPRGSVYGILGPNGSGKTTTLGMLLGVIRSSSGSYSWFGQGEDANALKRIGAILENPNFYPYLSGIDNLKIVADIKGVSYDRIPEVLDQVHLLERGKDPFKAYSLGMKQRLAIGSALLNKPEVMVLDEPTNGLDPAGIAEIRSLIGEIATQGTTILLASHLLDEVEKVCTDVVILKNGVKLYDGPSDQIVSTNGIIEFASNDNDKLLKLLQAHPNAKQVEKNGRLIIFTPLEKPNVEEMAAELSAQGLALTHLNHKKSSLEDQFLELTKQ
jgi:ABC-2 type transport system ATP-binding protein